MSGETRDECRASNWLRSFLHAEEPVFLGGTWAGIDAALGHLHTCQECQSTFPGAQDKLRGMRADLDAEVRGTLNEERNKYLAIKFDAAAHPSRDGDARVLASLMAAGDRLSEALYCVNTSGLVFVGFIPSLRVSEDTEGNEEVIESRVGCSDFLATLSDDDQAFIAASTMAQCFIGRSFDPRIEGGVEAAYEALVRAAAFNASVLVALLELGARGVLEQNRKDCSDFRRRFPKVLGEQNDQDGAVQSVSGELYRYLDDRIDSLAAGQMEIIRQLEKSHHSDNATAEAEQMVHMRLGEKLFFALEATTRKCLIQAEAEYQDQKSGHEYTSAMWFGTAFENEFNIRIRQPLAEALITEGWVDYPTDGERRLVRRRRINERLTVGELLRLIKTDERLKKQLQTHGLDAGEVVGRCDGVWDLRNKIHGIRDFRPEFADGIRDLLLQNRQGAFAAIVRLPNEQSAAI